MNSDSASPVVAMPAWQYKDSPLVRSDGSRAHGSWYQIDDPIAITPGETFDDACCRAGYERRESHIFGNVEIMSYVKKGVIGPSDNSVFLACTTSEEERTIFHPLLMGTGVFLRFMFPFVSGWFQPQSYNDFLDILRTIGPTPDDKAQRDQHIGVALLHILQHQYNIILFGPGEHPNVPIIGGYGWQEQTSDLEPTGEVHYGYGSVESLLLGLLDWLISITQDDERENTVEVDDDEQKVLGGASVVSIDEFKRITETICGGAIRIHRQLRVSSQDIATLMNETHAQTGKTRSISPGRVARYIQEQRDRDPLVFIQSEGTDVFNGILSLDGFNEDMQPPPQPRLYPDSEMILPSAHPKVSIQSYEDEGEEPVVDWEALPGGLQHSEMAFGATSQPHAVPVFTLSGPHPDHAYDSPCVVDDGAAIHTILLESGEQLSCIVVGNNDGRGQKQHLLPVLNWDDSPVTMPRLLYTVITGQQTLARFPKSLADIKHHHYVARPWHREQQHPFETAEALLVGRFQPLDVDTKIKTYEISGDYLGQKLIGPNLYHIDESDPDILKISPLVDVLPTVEMSHAEDIADIPRLLEQEQYTTIPMIGSVSQIITQGHIAPTKSGTRGRTPQVVMFLVKGEPIMLRAPLRYSWNGETDPLCVMYDGETVIAMWFSGRVSAETDDASPMPAVLAERYWM
jgi:hypothetical protein